MLPRIRDWFRNPQKAATDLSTFGVAVEAITQPLLAYEKEVNSIWNARMHRYFVRPLAWAIPAFMLVTGMDPKSTKAYEFAEGEVVAIAYTVMASRKMRASSAATVTLRTLHPEMHEKFDVIEDVFQTIPRPHIKDYGAARQRAVKMQEYAARLGVNL
jgi:hypothetical protein